MVDYKAQYLKYKFKYLQAKDLSKNKLKNKNFKGGNGEEILMSVLGIGALAAGLAYYKYVGNKNSYDDLASDYNILGVSVDASDQEIRSAYRTLAKQTHPDKNSSSTAEEDFKILVNAYDSIKKSRGFSGGSINKNLTFEEAEQLFKNEFNVSAKDI